MEDPLHRRQRTMLINKTAETTNSFNNNEGIVQANQDVGNMVNQGNNVAVAMTNGDSAPFAVSVDTDPDGFAAGSFTHSEGYSEQVNVRNQTYHHELSPFDNGPPAAGLKSCSMLIQNSFWRMHRRT